MDLALWRLNGGMIRPAPMSWLDKVVFWATVVAIVAIFAFLFWVSLMNR